MLKSIEIGGMYHEKNSPRATISLPRLPDSLYSGKKFGYALKLIR